ncbi:MAG: hypothetical protein LBG60_07565 [Bifidobacteriaceae bacterium]|nr:hypothetical protein [Bifidobacteriaceae bacterium]
MPDRWFADESVLGFGKLLARERDGVLYPGHPALPSVPLGSSDVVWMRVAADLGLVAFHRDKHIRSRPLEVAQFHRHGLRSVWLAGKKDMSAPAQLDLALRHWDSLERLVADLGAGPWSLTLTAHGFAELVWTPLARKRGGRV